jgi:hypothetical protein
MTYISGINAYSFPGVPTVIAMPRAFALPLTSTFLMGTWMGVKSQRISADTKTAKKVKKRKKREMEDILNANSTQCGYGEA